MKPRGRKAGLYRVFWKKLANRGDGVCTAWHIENTGQSSYPVKLPSQITQSNYPVKSDRAQSNRPVKSDHAQSNLIAPSQI